MAGKANPEAPDEGGNDRISMSVTIKRGRATVHSINDFVTTPRVAGQMLKTIAEDLDPAKTTGAPWMPHPPGPGIRGIATNGAGSSGIGYEMASAVAPPSAQEQPGATLPPQD